MAGKQRGNKAPSPLISPGNNRETNGNEHRKNGNEDHSFSFPLFPVSMITYPRPFLSSQPSFMAFLAHFEIVPLLTRISSASWPHSVTPSSIQRRNTFNDCAALHPTLISPVTGSVTTCHSNAAT